MANLQGKLSEFIGQDMDINTFGSDGSEKVRLLEVGDDYILVNPSTAWDDQKVRLIPFSAIDTIEVVVKGE